MSADPVAHHAEHAAHGLKKKAGPLPVWAWVAIAGAVIFIYMMRKSSSSATQNGSTVDPNSPLGLTYAQEQADMASGIDPNTGQSYASEQSAAGSLMSSGGGGVYGGSGGSSSDPITAELTAIDGDLQGLQQTLYANGGVTDTQTPEQTFAGQLQQTLAGITALQAMEHALTPTPPTAKSGAKKPSTTKSGTLTTPSAATANAASKVQAAQAAAIHRSNAAAAAAMKRANHILAKKPHTPVGAGLGPVVVRGKKR